MNWKFFLYGIAAAALLPAVVCAQASFDSSGNSLLNGTYFIREVLNANISSIGQIGEAESLTGTISFSGGSYTLTAQLSDNTVSSGAPQQLSTMGNYSVNASGMFAMDDPLSNGDTLYGGIGPSAIVGSASRSSSIDFMVAVPIAASASNSSLSGAYRVVGLEYPNGDVTEVSNYSFLVNPDGGGNLSESRVAPRYVLSAALCDLARVGAVVADDAGAPVRGAGAAQLTMPGRPCEAPVPLS